MDNSLRLQYLQAMGIDVWLPHANKLAPADAFETMIEASFPVERDTPYAQQNWATLCQIPSAESHCAITATGQSLLTAQPAIQDWLILIETLNSNQTLPQALELLLDDMLLAIGLNRKQIVATLAFTEYAVQTNLHQTAFIQRQIELLQPKIILVMGENIAKNLLQSPATITQLRGTVHQLPMQTSTATLIVTYPPEHLLQTAADKYRAWQDLQLAMSAINR